MGPQELSASANRTRKVVTTLTSERNSLRSFVRSGLVKDFQVNYRSVHIPSKAQSIPIRHAPVDFEKDF